MQLPPITLPAILAPLITTKIGTATRTITPPVYDQAAITPEPITISAKPSVTNAASTTTASILFNQTGLLYPSFDYVDPSNSNNKHNISGIIIPFPLKYGGPPGISTGTCWFLCDWPPTMYVYMVFVRLAVSLTPSLCRPPISVSNGSPWPRLKDPEPPSLKDNPEDFSDDSGDEDQPQEPGTTGPTPTSGPTKAPTTTPSSTATSESDEEDDCTAIPTVLLGTDGISLASGGWASAYPTVSFHPIYGSNLAIFGSYAPIIPQPQYITDNRASTTTAPVKSTSASTSAKPTSSSLARYFWVLTGEPDPNSTDQTDHWLGYDNDTPNSFDICVTTNQVLSVAYQAFGPTRPLYPESLPSINLGSHQNCVFKYNSQDSSHAMHCADGKTFTCEEYGNTGHGVPCTSGNGGFKTVYPKLRCSYT